MTSREGILKRAHVQQLEKITFMVCEGASFNDITPLFSTPFGNLRPTLCFKKRRENNKHLNRREKTKIE